MRAFLIAAAPWYWTVWAAMLVIADPLAELLGGERATDTHYLATHIPAGIRAALLGWLAWHFLVQHLSG